MKNKLNTEVGESESPRPDCEFSSSPESELAFDDELNPEDGEGVILPMYLSREQFIHRLVCAGWTLSEAEDEWGGYADDDEEDWEGQL